MPTFDIHGRIGHIRVGGSKLWADLAEAVTKASVDISSTQITQLTLDVVESADFGLLRRNLFNPGGVDSAGTAVSFGDLELECRAVELRELGDQHMLTMTARTAGVYKLKRSRGKIIRRKTSPTRFAEIEARAVGLKFVGQPSPTRPSIFRTDDESAWDTLQRLAQELGYLCWEAAGTVYFGQPTWFVGRGSRLSVPWRGRDTNPGILKLPNCRRSGDDEKAAAQVDLSAAWAYASGARPGMGFDLFGIPTYDGRYMIDSVRIDLGEGQPISVSASTPINPVPQPPQTDEERKSAGSGSGSATSTNVARPKAGRYGGTTFNATQLGHALTIYKVAKSRGLGDRGAVVGIATALQESTLRNLSYGDRDSVGLFQQRRPWGSFAQRTNPKTSAGFFYDKLVKVRGWKTLPVSVAAQRVQISAFPNAYAKWQPEAEAIVRAINASARTVVRKTPSSGSKTPSGSGGSSGGGRAKSPVPSHPRVTYGFGIRNSGYAAGYHTGEDYGSGGIGGARAVAVRSGVARVGPGGAYGNSVLLKADNGHTYLYAHLSRRVNLGRVSAGTTIGYVGSTGNATGPHLHLEQSSGSTWSYGRVKNPSW